MDIDNVSWSEVIAAARLRRASLVPESAGYLMLGLIRAMGGRPLQVAPSRILLSTEGAVTLASPCRRVTAAETAATLQRLLGLLLGVSQEKATALRVIADGETPRLERLFSSVTKALIPINRAAARRALARLARETVRARQRGQLRPEDLPEDETLLAPEPSSPGVERGPAPSSTATAASPRPEASLSPATPSTPACEPAWEDLEANIELATPTPNPIFRPAAVLAYASADLEAAIHPSPSVPPVCVGETTGRDTLQDPIPPVRVGPAVEVPATATPSPSAGYPEVEATSGPREHTEPLSVPVDEAAPEHTHVATAVPPALEVPIDDEAAHLASHPRSEPDVAEAASFTETPALPLLDVRPSAGPAAAPTALEDAADLTDLSPDDDEDVAQQGHTGPMVVAEASRHRATPIMGCDVEPRFGAYDRAPVSAPSSARGSASRRASFGSTDGEVRAVGPAVVAEPVTDTHESDDQLTDHPIAEGLVAESPVAEASPHPMEVELPDPSQAPAAGAPSHLADELGLAERLRGRVARLPAARRRQGSALLGPSHGLDDLLDDFVEDGDSVGAVAASLKSMMDLSPTPAPGVVRAPLTGAPTPAQDTVSGLSLERDLFAKRPRADLPVAADSSPGEDEPADPSETHEPEAAAPSNDSSGVVSEAPSLDDDEPEYEEVASTAAPIEEGATVSAPLELASSRETRPDGTLPEELLGDALPPRPFLLEAPLDDGDEEEAVQSVSPPPVASESHDDGSFPPPEEEDASPPPRRRLVAGMLTVAAIAAGAVLVQQRPEVLDRAQEIAAPLVDRVTGPKPAAQACRADVRLAELPRRHEVLSFLGTTPLRTDALPQGVRLELVATANDRLPERILIPSDASWNEGGELHLGVELEEGASAHWPSAPPGRVGGTGPAGHVVVESAGAPAEVWLVIASGEGADRVVQLPCEEPARLLVVDTADPSRQRRIDVAANLLSTAAEVGGADVAAQP